ncbi:MAG TPA: glycosyltransferase family 39 protein [Vicinamibacteria bacterium]|nr:glycosyltransferase family 39 protein [Vicinamibacteria bacterium]
MLALAAALRLWRLSLPALTSDEAYSWRLTTYPAADLARRTAEDVHSPAFYLLLKGWLALAGESAFALRALSVMLSLGALALLFAAVREAGAGTAGALAAGVLFALHPLQLQQGRNARMYALGLLLAALTSALLLRVLRQPGRALGWWAAYGAAAALFVYAHYYALFTLAAQAVGALLLARGRRAAVAAALALAAAVALALLAPWLPALLDQARRVREEYWIPPATGRALLSAVLRWATGLAEGPIALAALAGWVAVAGWGLARARAAASFFLLQAVLPWLLALVVSVAGGRPLFLERFTVFAQVALLALLGVAWSWIPRVPRLLAAAAIAAALLGGAGTFLHALPQEPPALTEVVRYIRRWRRPGDVVVVDSPRALNKLLFYGQRDGLREVPVRALPGVAGGGHYTHLSSLAPGELVPQVEAAAWGPRLWRASEQPHPVPPPPAGWSMGFARVFEGGEGSRYLLVRYDRPR